MRTSIVPLTLLVVLVLLSWHGVVLVKASSSSSSASSTTATSTAATAATGADSTTTTCDASDAEAVNDYINRLQNSAFVFIKPHANTIETQKLVKSKLLNEGIHIVNELDIDGVTIDQKQLIDQHYYSIASKATILQPNEIVVNSNMKELFHETFQEVYDDVLLEERICNALQAMKLLNCNTVEELNSLWQQIPKEYMIKFGGGFYCGRIQMKNDDDNQSSPPKYVYVFNGFFMSMRNKFVGPDNSIHCYVVEWDPKVLSWKSFRNDILGPTDPNEAPDGSIRKTILQNYQALGIKEKPNKGDNGVHASASPFEGLVEKMNWLQLQLTTSSEDDDNTGDAFGTSLIKYGGISKETIIEWSKDPQVLRRRTKATKNQEEQQHEEEDRGSIFDTLEDMDAVECYHKLVELNEIN